MQASLSHSEPFAVLLRAGSATAGAVVALFACGPLAGVEEKPCRPGCVDERTRLVCDAGGIGQSVPCPEPTESCAAAYCIEGACGIRPAVGRPCGTKGLAHCNEGYACLGPDLKLTAGFSHTCALDDDGKVWCWGLSTYGRLGDGTNDPSHGRNPVRVVGLPRRAIAVSGGIAHTCALAEGGEAYCWGDNNYGKAVPGADISLTSAERVGTPEGVHFTDIRAGASHTCALATDGTVFCWGVTVTGECGVDGRAEGIRQVEPTRIPNLDLVVSIECVKDHTCALRAAAPWVVCWGENRHEETTGEPFVVDKLGPNAAGLEYSAKPVPVDFGTEQVIAVGMGYDSTFAIVGGGRRIYGFGLNTDGRLGTGSADPIVATPTTVKTRGIQDLVVDVRSGLEIVRTGGANQCVRTTDGRYFCWGTDKNGELGLESRGVQAPYAVEPSALPPGATNLVHGDAHACFTVTTREPPDEEHTEISCYGNNALVGNGSADGGKNQLTAAPVIWSSE